MMRLLIAAVLVMSTSSIAHAHTKPAPAQNLSYSADTSDVKLDWVVPRQEFGVEYFVDICRLERGTWLRIFGTYARRPTFTLEHPRPKTAYAWRVLSVDAEDRRNFSSTAWQFLRTPAPTN